MASTGIAQSIVDQQKWLDTLSGIIQPPISDLFANAGEAGRIIKDLLNGVWLGHPLHPVITDVPIGAWTMTQVLDLLSMASGGDANLDVASDVTLGAGIIAALGAVVTGITDWSDIDQNPRKRMGMAHAVINVAGLALNVSSLGLRLGGKRRRGLARTLSAGGYGLTALAAFVAGELVFNLGTSINRNAWTDGPDKFTDLAAEDDITEGKMQQFEVDGNPIVVVKDEDGVHAFGATCSHLGCDLSEGKLEGHVVTCGCHGSQFDITDGHLIHGPATAPVPAYEVRKRNGKLQIRLSRSES